MRTRTSWLAWLLTTGIALVPTAVRAQGAAAGWLDLNAPPPPVQAGVGNALAPSWPGGDETPTSAPQSAQPVIPAFPMPYEARGQALDYDVPETDPDHAFPFPLGHDRMETGGFFVAAEFMFWRQTNPLKNQTIAVRGLRDTDGTIHAALPTGVIENPPHQPILAGPPVSIPGGFIGSGVPALSSADASGPSSYSPGYRITAGYRFQEGFVVEASYLHIQDVRYNGGATLAPPNADGGPLLADTFLYAPVYNFPNNFAGPANKLAIGSPTAAFGIWNAATQMSVQFDQFIESASIGGRIPIFETEYNRCSCLVGFSNFWIWENFQWRTVDTNYQGVSPDGASDAATYSNVVSNEMYGPYIGSGNEFWLGKGFSVSCDGRAGLMVDFVHEEAKYSLGNRTMDLKRARREYRISPTLTGLLNLNWHPIEGVEIRVGYTLMALFNTVASPYPVSFNAMGIDPPWQTQVLRMVDGFNVGLGFIF